MTGLFVMLIAVAGFGFVAAWLGENPGNVTVLWFGYQIETSAAVLIAAAIIAAMAATFVYNLLKRIILTPRHYAERRSVKQYRVALSEITQSVAALAASDTHAAAKHTRKAEKALGTTPLTLLLRAQISKSAGSDDETRILLEQLLEHPETEYLAAKSLADVAQKRQLLPQALGLAERAHRMNPKAKGGAWSLFDLHLSSGNFQDAELQAKAARKSGAFSRTDLATAQGRVALKQAEISISKGNKDHALVFAERAVKLMPGDVKAVECCANLYAEMNRIPKAITLIQVQWRVQPSDNLAQLFIQITEDERPIKREKLIEKLVASNEAAPENVTLRAI